MISNVAKPVRIALLASVMVALSTPTLAKDTPDANGDADKKVCKRETLSTGSIMPKRVCRTKAEWDAITAQSQRDLERQRSQENDRSMVGATR